MYKILIVDDESSEREGISFLIKKYEFPLKIVEASNGQEALDYVKEHHVDILFTDIKMPYMDGLELARNVYELYPDMSIIIFSAHDEFDYAKDAIEVRAVDYLLKPIDLDEFRKLMMKVIDQCDQADEEKQSEIEQLLFQVLTGAPVSISDKLRPVFTNRWNTFLYVEFNKGIFPEKEENILKIIDMYVPKKYSFVLINHFSAYVILHDDSKLSEKEQFHFAHIFSRDAELLLHNNPAVLIGSTVYGLQEVEKAVETLNRLKETIYWGEEYILFADQVTVAAYDTEKMEKMRSEMLEILESGNIKQVEESIDRLIDSSSNTSSTGASYIHHLFYSLIPRIYQIYGIYDQSLIMSKLDKVMKCREIESLRHIFHTLIDEIYQNGTFIHNREVNVTEKVMEIIKKEYSTNIGLDDIAEKVYFSPAYLSYFYKQETGETITKHLSDYRLKKAKELLVGSNRKVSQIAKLCGYQNNSYFTRLFKRTQGVTPTQFRESRK